MAVLVLTFIYFFCLENEYMVVPFSAYVRKPLYGRLIFKTAWVLYLELQMHEWHSSAGLYFVVLLCHKGVVWISLSSGTDTNSAEC